MTGFEAYGKQLMVQGGMSEDEASEIIKGCIDTAMTNKQHAYYLQFVFPPQSLRAMLCGHNFVLVTNLTVYYSWHVVARKPE